MDISRKEIQKWMLDEYDILIKKHGADAIEVACPMPGKNSWTYQEMRDAVEKDEVPENYGNNPIDEFIHFIEFTESVNEPFEFKHTEL